jgi:transposase InsO family protein
MAYSNNINLPKARGIALKLVFYEQLPVSVVARKCGVHRTTVWRWLKKWQDLNQHVSLTNANRVHRQPGTRFRLDACTWTIPTLSSRPKTFPRAIADWLVERVLELRYQLKRCAEVIWHRLNVVEGLKISLSSVRRILARHHEYDRRKYQKKLYRRNIRRPLPESPGDLVQVDTVHLVDSYTGQRKYIYTVIDLCTRMAYARVYDKLSQIGALETVLIAEAKFGFAFRVVQADNGPEFGRLFKERLEASDKRKRKCKRKLRHSRPHRPNDNAHIERFNRTLRQECVGHYMSSGKTIQQVQGKLDTFLDYYNNERVHLSLECMTPAEFLGLRLQRC